MGAEVSCGEASEHQLTHRESVAPVVIRHLSVVLLRRNQPLHHSLYKQQNKN